MKLKLTWITRGIRVLAIEWILLGLFKHFVILSWYCLHVLVVVCMDNGIPRYRPLNCQMKTSTQNILNLVFNALNFPRYIFAGWRLKMQPSRRAWKVWSIWHLQFVGFVYRFWRWSFCTIIQRECLITEMGEFVLTFLLWWTNGQCQLKIFFWVILHLDLENCFFILTRCLSCSWIFFSYAEMIRCMAGMSFCRSHCLLDVYWTSHIMFHRLKNQLRLEVQLLGL